MKLVLERSRQSARIFFIGLAVLFLLRCFLSAEQPASKYPPTVVFMTDFGTLDDSVALCKGVMYGITPNLRIVDLTHQVTQFKTAHAFFSALRPTTLPGPYSWRSLTRV